MKQRMLMVLEDAALLFLLGLHLLGWAALCLFVVALLPILLVTWIYAAIKLTYERKRKPRDFYDPLLPRFDWADDPPQHQPLAQHRRHRRGVTASPHRPASLRHSRQRH